MESINTRIIEFSIKKRMKRMKLTALLSLSGVCLLCHPLQAQQSIDACDGRTYKVGDTLRIGEPLPSGYLFVKRINADNKFDKLNPKNLNRTDCRHYRHTCLPAQTLSTVRHLPTAGNAPNSLCRTGRFQDWRISKHGFNQR